MKKEEFNETYKKFEKVHKGIYLLQLNFLNKIEKGNLEIIVEFNKPQDEIDNMNLRKEYKNVPIIYKENPDREIKIINFHLGKIKNYSNNSLIKRIIEDTKSF